MIGDTISVKVLPPWGLQLVLPCAESLPRVPTAAVS